MTLNAFQHRGLRWRAVLRTVASPEVETGLEVVFVPDDGRRKYAWPLEPRTLDAVVEGGISLDRHRLRRMFRRAADAERRPSYDPRAPDGGGVLARTVRELLA